MKLLRQFCVLLCNRKEKIMQIRKPCKNKGLFRTKMIWKIKVRFRATSGSSLRQDRGRQEAEPGTACAHLRSTAKKNSPDQLLIRRTVGERGKTCCTYLNLFSGAPHSRCGRQEGLAYPRLCMAARFSLRICRLACQLPAYGARTKCGWHFAGFAPAAHLGCSRVCGACVNDC